ncbi:phage Gp37/Gp68 family protein [Streptomyces sp. CBMA152]|uniref:phage Gp37/Gp68 family protein n=1 Tax=Streptomyces sp. CBMA152 TaxID=1896312 RepID=UPI0016613908|nr:phage Gp37/Gp68 family protein [Streptomyces sp. CBMA152]MBD0743496.1 hypothetical protein [Streptomyces sp. CBMA152]
MATDTSIEWADKTWSPIIGCDRVSPGCDNCYAITQARIRSNNPNPTISEAFAGTVDRIGGRLDWTGKINLLPERLTQPLRWKKPRRIFVNSLSDLFHKDVPAEYIAQVFAVMALTPQHTYQILTKRHARMRSMIGGPCRCGHQPGEHLRSGMAWAVSKANPNRISGVPDNAEQRVYGRGIWPLPNVWMGVSVEDQKWANIRIPALLQTPAAVRFLSCEPLFGPVDLKQAVIPMGSERGHGLTASYVHAGDCCRRFHGIDWVIVGGESGHGARPMAPQWATSLRDQCAAADVPFFFKQFGEYAPTGYLVIGGTTKGTLLAGEPVDDLGHRVELARVGKKAAGRELDGRTHDAFPKEVAHV